MKIGITGHLVEFGPNLIDVAKAVEDLGFESFWAGEHIFVPVDIADPVRHGKALPEAYRYMGDLFVALSLFAAVTKRIKLGSSVCLVPQRHPLMLAKQVASLDCISAGRLILGIGSGWIEEESQILQVPFKQRVKLTSEYLRALKVIWSEKTPAFAGEFVSFPPVHSNPKPQQKPHPPLLIGAGTGTTNNSAILKRVANTADGWLPVAMSPVQMKEQLQELKGYCAECGRDFDKMDISVILPSIFFGIDQMAPETNVDLKNNVDKEKALDLLAQYESAGVTRIIVLINDMTSASALGTLEKIARNLNLKN